MNSDSTEPVVEPARSYRRLFLAVAITAMLMVAASFVLWERYGTSKSKLEVVLGSLDFYNTTLSPPTDGHILWRISFLFANAEEEPLIVDPCDFLVVGSDGTEYHFAWRVGNLTSMEIVTTIYEVNLELPPSRVGNMQAPYEMPDDTFPVRLIWRSALGDVASSDFGEYGQQRLDNYAEMTAQI